MKTIASAHTLVIRTSENTDSKTSLDYIAVKNAAMTLRAINHKLRQQIIRLLEESKRMNVTDLYVKLHLEQSVTSQHLAILRRANIVITEREGKCIYYALNHARIAAVAVFTNRLTTIEGKEINKGFELKDEPDSIIKVKKDINALKCLERNWDDEGASPIDKVQIEKALSFVDDQFKSTLSVPSFIAPTLDSGVLIEFANKRKRIDVRFENSNPFMTIFESGRLLYNGGVDSKTFRQHIK